MINGHGDDAFRYDHISINFSTNISQHANHSLLKAHLTGCFDLISNYPEPEAWTLERALARRLGLDEACVLVTSGATEAIYLIAQAYAHLPYDIDQPTFSEYEDACRMFGLHEGKGGLGWICNPRNPDGHVYTEDELTRLTADHELLVIDQAYERYTRKAVCHVPTAVTLHSLTKDYAVPGLRIGYVTAPAPVVERLRRYMRPWSVNALAIEAALFLLEHDELLMRPDLDEAQRLNRRLNGLCGITALPTDTNFMLCRLEHHTAAEVKDHLARRHGMLIRDASNFRGLDEHYFRVAAQLPEENDLLVDVLSLACE